MRIGIKTKRLLETVAMLGGETAAALLQPHRTIREGAGLSASRSTERAIRVVESEGWVRRRTGEADAEGWAVRLTERAWEDVMDGIDPERAWAAAWDGRWRTLSFDLPADARDARYQLSRWLKKRRFGHLQGSLWVTPRPYKDWSEELAERKIDPRLVVFLEGRAIGRLSDADYVSAAWRFDTIDAGYREYLAFLEEEPLPSERGEPFEDWQRKESKAWGDAFAADPFLPDSLLPHGYLGKGAWSRRKSTYAELAKRLV